MKEDPTMSYVPVPAAIPNQWYRILGALEKKINRQSYETWLKPTRFSHITGRTLYVRIPSEEFQHVGERYGDHIGEAIETLGLELDQVVFQVPPEQARFDWNTAAQLNPRYQFDAFVIGSGNQFARAAAAGRGRAPRQGLQPAVPVRRRGHGQDAPDARHRPRGEAPPAHRRWHLLRLGEKFTNEMITSCATTSMTSFRDRFRTVDVLLIDDIQFIAARSAPRRSSSTPSTRCTRA
jgi:chromosomal replication initiator protein